MTGATGDGLRIAELVDPLPLACADAEAGERAVRDAAPVLDRLLDVTPADRGVRAALALEAEVVTGAHVGAGQTEMRNDLVDHDTVRRLGVNRDGLPVADPATPV